MHFSGKSEAHESRMASLRVGTSGQGGDIEPKQSLRSGDMILLTTPWESGESLLKTLCA